MSLSLGQVLDPVNDLVESLSSVMLVASVAFGVQKLLLAIGSDWWVSACLTLIAFVWALLFLWNRSPQWLFRLVGILLFIRFVMPVATIGSSIVFDHFIEAKYSASQAALDQTTRDLQALTLSTGVVGDAAEQAPETPAPATDVEQPSAEGTGIAARIRKFWQGTKDVAAGAAASATAVIQHPTESIRQKYHEIEQKAEATVDRMITLIEIFVMQTVIVPILLLLGLYWLCWNLFNAQPRREVP